MKSAALAHVARGFAVVPCWPRKKRPATDNGLKDAVTDAAGVERLWAKRIPYNIAAVTGAVSGVFVVDIDGPDGAANLRALEEQHGALPPTLVCLTGKGSHLYFRHPGVRVRPNSNGKVSKGIDIRGDGSMAMLPPSIHPSGTRYRWVVPDVPIADAPAWLLELVLREPERIAWPIPVRKIIADRLPDHEVERMLSFLDPDMDRDSWVRVGMALHAGGYPFEMYDRWSSGATRDDSLGNPLYNRQTCEAQWRGFREGGVGMGTLVVMAKRAGWEREPRHIENRQSNSRTR